MMIKALLGCVVLLVSGLASAQLQIEHATIRAMPPGQKVTAAYMMIANHTQEARTLVGVNSAVTSHIEIHQNLMEEGVMKMRQLEGLIIPAHGTASLEANGNHLMMFNLSKDLLENEHIMLNLEFDDGSKQQVMAIVKRTIGMAHGQTMNHESSMQKITPTKKEIYSE